MGRRERIQALMERIKDKGIIHNFYIGRSESGDNCFCVIGHMADMAGVSHDVLREAGKRCISGDAVLNIPGEEKRLRAVRRIREAIEEYYGLTTEQLQELQDANDERNNERVIQLLAEYAGEKGGTV